MTDRRHELLKNPVKSNRGGYLRCPFQIDPSFAAMATRNVMKGSTSSESAEATRRRLDGLDYNADTKSGQSDTDFALMEDGLIEGRPWLRAGVGAKQMSAKDKQEQQRLAEKIYGVSESNPDANDPDMDANASREEERNTSGFLKKSGRMDSVQAASRFGTSNGERTALRKLLKPSEQKNKSKTLSANQNDREKRVRESGAHEDGEDASDEETRITKSGSVSMKHARTERLDAPSNRPSAAASLDKQKHGTSNAGGSKNQKPFHNNTHSSSSNTASKPSWNSSQSTDSRSGKIATPNAPSQNGSLRQSSNAASKEATASKNLKDMNPLKRFELMRQAALFGNKKKR